jgi:hypothetical protein
MKRLRSNRANTQSAGKNSSAARLIPRALDDEISERGQSLFQTGVAQSWSLRHGRARSVRELLRFHGLVDVP